MDEKVCQTSCILYRYVALWGNLVYTLSMTVTDRSKFMKEKMILVLETTLVSGIYFLLLYMLIRFIVA